MGSLVQLLARSISLLANLAAPEVHLHEQSEPIGGKAFRVVDVVDRASELGPATPDRPRPVRVRVAVEAGLEDHAEAFAVTVQRVLSDPAGWAAAGRPLRLVDEGEDITVLLATPDTTDRLCAPLRTAGVYSCGRNRRATINLDRWVDGATSWSGDLDGYRTYVINHEVGHLLSQPHQRCPGPGEPAPVMVQQTISLFGCARANRPAADEIERLRARWTELGLVDAS